MPKRNYKCLFSFLTTFLPLSWYLLYWSPIPFLLFHTTSPSVFHTRSVSYYFSLFWQQCQRYMMSTSNHVDIAVTGSNSVSPSVILLMTILTFQFMNYFRQNPKVNDLCINLYFWNNSCVWCRITLLLLKQP